MSFSTRFAPLLAHIVSLLSSVGCTFSGANGSNTTVTTITFTLGIVLSNPNITSDMLLKILEESENRIQDDQYSVMHRLRFLTSKQYAIANRRGFVRRRRNIYYKLQIQPVYTVNTGLNRILKNIFCMRSSQGMNALFVLVDKNFDPNAPHLTNILSQMTNLIGLPMMTWSTSTSEVSGQVLTQSSLKMSEQNYHLIHGNAFLETVLLAPTIASQARAIYAFLKQVHSERKAAIVVSTKTPGYEIFLNEIREISNREDKRYSLFDFDSHQFHMTSRVIETVLVESFTKSKLRQELGAIRDHTEVRAFILYAHQEDSNNILKEAHHLGMTSAEYLWICGKPSFGEDGDLIPFNYVPGVIAVTYNTSLNVQLTALKTAIEIWGDSFTTFLNRAKLKYYESTGESMPVKVQKELLAPRIKCDQSRQKKWQFAHLMHSTLRERLDNLIENKADEGLLGLSDIIFMELQFSRAWKRIGSWTALSSTGSIKIDDPKWLLEADKNHVSEVNFVRIATLEEPPYVVYEFPDQKTGKCTRKALPCRLSSQKLRPDDFADIAHDVTHAELDDKMTTRVNHIGAVNHHANGSLMCCMGYSMDLLRRLSADIGFDFELFEVEDRKWGAPDRATGRWNGLVEELLSGKADMVVTSLKINSERTNVIDFSIPFFETGVTILVRLREGMISQWAFLEPFSKETWLVIFFGCVNAFAVIIFTFELIYHRFYYQSKYAELKRFSLIESFWVILCMLFNATGNIKQPKSLSSRFVTTLWSFICLILVSSFMANLAAFMITKDDYHDFTGVDDYRLKNPFSRNPPWRFATIPHGATETILKSNFPDMHDYMKPYMKATADVGVQAVRQGDLDAFIYDASVLEYKVGRDKECSLRTVGKWYALTGYGIALPKMSKWLQPINKFMVDYQRSGYLQHLEEYWLASACKERQMSDLRNKSNSLRLGNLMAVFVISFCCLLACTIYLFVEYIFMRYCRKSCFTLDKCKILAILSPKMGQTIKYYYRRSVGFGLSRVFSQTRKVQTRIGGVGVGPRNLMVKSITSTSHRTRRGYTNSIIRAEMVKEL